MRENTFPEGHSPRSGVLALERQPVAPGLSAFFRLHNPLYLASAAFMLLGCYLLAGTGHWWSRPQRVIALVLVLNVYELLVIALACYLIKARGLLRDGRMLLLIEVLLLVDSTNLLAESFALDLSMGALVNAGALLLAVVKATVVVRLLGLRYRMREVLAAAAGFLGMLTVPGLVAWGNYGGATMDLRLHAAWWAAGALAVGLAVLTPRARREMSALERSLGRAALLAPWLSLVGHLLLSCMVYEAEFRFCNLAPVLLGLVAAAVHRRPEWIAGRRLGHLLAWSAVLCLALTALTAPRMSADLPGFEGVVYSPLRGTLLALSLLFLWAALAGLGRVPAAFAGALFVSAASGHTPGGILATWGEILSALVPRTQEQWGLVSLLAAFLTLGAGAVASLLRRRPPEPREIGGAR